MNKVIHHMIKAALAAGTQVMEVYRGEVFVEMKNDKSPLTEADRRGHDTIQSVLRAPMNAMIIEQLPIMSEEGTIAPYLQRAGWSEYFLIDPLDGTKEFIKKNDEFTVNIALMRQDESDEVLRERLGGDPKPLDVIAARRWSPIAGVVFAPALGELFVGDDDGAWRWTDISGLTVPDRSDAEAIPRATADRPYTIVASRSHMSPETEAFVEQRRLEHPDLDLVSAGSSLKICRVADGSADEYPRFAPTMEWDTAAGDAVARAAGCEVLAYSDGSDGEPPRSQGQVTYNKKDLHNPWFLIRRVPER